MLHIAIVCAGYKETKRVATLVKSILIYRQHPLTFHFISDIAGRHVLSVLFKTWKLQQGQLLWFCAESFWGGFGRPNLQFHWFNITLSLFSLVYFVDHH